MRQAALANVVEEQVRLDDAVDRRVGVDVEDVAFDGDYILGCPLPPA